MITSSRMGSQKNFGIGTCPLLFDNEYEDENEDNEYEDK